MLQTKPVVDLGNVCRGIYPSAQKIVFILTLSILKWTCSKIPVLLWTLPNFLKTDFLHGIFLSHSLEK